MIFIIKNCNFLLSPFRNVALPSPSQNMQIMKVTWQGVYPALTTKFHEDGSLDLPLFRKNIRAQLEAGVHGIIIGGRYDTAVEAAVAAAGDAVVLDASSARDLRPR